jgi:hypothetical protein
MQHPLLRGRQPGQAAVLAALCFTLLIAALGLALDGANAFGERRRLANAVDAAALAGARTLLANQSHGNGGGRINTAIRDFLTDRHDLPGITWQAFYVDRLTPDVAIAPVVNGGRPPSGADGVRIEASYSFPTYFMGVFGQRTLGASGAASAVFGPLGTAVGQDLAPLAISVNGLEILKREGRVTVDMRNRLAVANGWDLDESLVPDDVITASNVRHVSFAEIDVPPTTGDDCADPAAESLTAWWCNGTPNRLRINRQLPSGSANYSRLNSAIAWRESHRDVLVLPVYADIGIYYQLVNFVAVELRDFDSGDGTLELELMPNYATAGAVVGEGSGVETGVWAINLTR